MESLRDGVKLCQLVNTIKPNSCKYKTIKTRFAQPFVERENIAGFLRACDSIGVPHAELFETEDLHDLNNPNQVLICLRSLSRHAHELNSNIPVMGPKLKSPTKRGNFADTSRPDLPEWRLKQYGVSNEFASKTAGPYQGQSSSQQPQGISINLNKSSSSPPPAKPPKPFNLRNVRPAPSMFNNDENSSDDGKEEDEIKKEQKLIVSEPQVSESPPIEKFTYDEEYDNFKGESENSGDEKEENNKEVCAVKKKKREKKQN